MKSVGAITVINTGRIDKTKNNIFHEKIPFLIQIFKYSNEDNQNYDNFLKWLTNLDTCYKCNKTNLKSFRSQSSILDLIKDKKKNCSYFETNFTKINSQEIDRSYSLFDSLINFLETAQLEYVNNYKSEMFTYLIGITLDYLFENLQNNVKDNNLNSIVLETILEFIKYPISTKEIEKITTIIENIINFQSTEKTILQRFYMQIIKILSKILNIENIDHRDSIKILLIILNKINMENKLNDLGFKAFISTINSIFNNPFILKYFNEDKYLTLALLDFLEKLNFERKCFFIKTQIVQIDKIILPENFAPNTITAKKKVKAVSNYSTIAFIVACFKNTIEKIGYLNELHFEINLSRQVILTSNIALVISRYISEKNFIGKEELLKNLLLSMKKLIIIDKHRDHSLICINYLLTTISNNNFDQKNQETFLLLIKTIAKLFPTKIVKGTYLLYNQDILNTCIENIIKTIIESKFGNDDKILKSVFFNLSLLLMTKSKFPKKLLANIVNKNYGPLKDAIINAKLDKSNTSELIQLINQIIMLQA